MPSADAIARGNGAVEEMSTYLRGLMAERRKQAHPDVLSDLIAARDGADRLTEPELLSTALLLFFAGHETTVNLIGNGVLALLQHPDQLALLHTQPSLISNTVEELLRFDSPVQRSFRAAAVDIELGGVLIPEGARVMALLGAANRDPRRFAAPDVLDIRRPDAKHHLSFGGGIHYCIGAPLARLEAEIALSSLIDRFPTLSLLEAKPEWRPNLIFRGLNTLLLGKD